MHTNAPIDTYHRERERGVGRRIRALGCMLMVVSDGSEIVYGCGSQEGKGVPPPTSNTKPTPEILRHFEND